MSFVSDVKSQKKIDDADVLAVVRYAGDAKQQDAKMQELALFYKDILDTHIKVLNEKLDSRNESAADRALHGVKIRCLEQINEVLKGAAKGDPINMRELHETVLKYLRDPQVVKGSFSETKTILEYFRDLANTGLWLEQQRKARLQIYASAAPQPAVPPHNEDKFRL